MITFEPRQIERIAIYDDALGYTFCTTCRHDAEQPSGKEPVTRRAEHPDHPGDARHTVCDRCGRPLTTSIEVVEGTAAVEHTPAKIL